MSRDVILSLMRAVIHVICCGLTAFLVIWVLMNLNGRPYHGLDLTAFESLPIQAEGRIKPLHTQAANLLRLLSGRSTYRFRAAGERHRLSAIEWYARLLFTPGAAEQDEVFRIDNPGLCDDLDLDAERKGHRYAMSELRPHQERLVETARNAEIRERRNEKLTSYDRSVLQLYGKMAAYEGVSQSLVVQEDFGFAECVESYNSLVPIVLALNTDRSSWSEEQSKAYEMLARLHAVIMELAARNQFRVLPPPTGQEHWLNPYDSLLLAAQREQARAPEGARHLLHMQKAWTGFHNAASGDVTAAAFDSDFNTAVFAWRGAQMAAPGMAKTWKRCRFEKWFDRFDPFYRAIVLYLAAFLLGCLAWACYPVVLNRYAHILLTISFGLHTVAIICRIFITGRAPVSSLYESTLFVGWVCVLLGLIVEWIFRNGMAVISAAVVGALTLLKGFQIAAGGIDTMPVLVAVLNSNFWLSTHVICITAGYASCYFAALIGHIYLFRGILTRSLNQDVALQLDRMAYGIICFGLLFSLVGTILGGIWADQSWGRFWGWDPKENGALLICLWLIIILHARMGGYIGARGTMVAVVVASVLTTLSWFGVNLLGTGLHAYGFTQRGFQSFVVFVLLESAVALVGALLPLRLWRSAAALETLASSSGLPLVGRESRVSEGA